MIGGFVLIMVGALFVFLIWLAKIDIDTDYTAYDIYFEESVAGLGKAGDVRYNGIPVGQVTSIKIAPEDPSKVLVQVKIESSAPILEDSVAVLSMQGLTGVAFVQIEGGSSASSMLEPEDGEERAVIRSRTSPIQDLFVGAPDLINEALISIGRLNTLLGDDNLERFAGILQNSEDFTGGLAARTENIEAVLVELETALRDFQSTAKAVQSVAEKADALMGEDVGEAVAEMHKLVIAANGLVGDLRGVVNENRGAVSAFTSTTLPEVSRLVSDARKLAITLERLAERLAESPAEVLFSPGKPEYEVK